MSGSLDAMRLEPSVALHNLAGKEFREWFYLPDFDAPGKYVTASVVGSASAGGASIFLSPQVLLGQELSPSGPLRDRLVATPLP